MPDPTPNHILALVAQIKPLFVGKDPGLVGAALAELTSIWLASHVIEGRPKETESLRAELFAYHMRSIAGLVHINARLIGAELAAATPAGRG